MRRCWERQFKLLRIFDSKDTPMPGALSIAATWTTGVMRHRVAGRSRGARPSRGAGSGRAVFSRRIALALAAALPDSSCLSLKAAPPWGSRSEARATPAIVEDRPPAPSLGGMARVSHDAETAAGTVSPHRGTAGGRPPRRPAHRARARARRVMSARRRHHHRPSDSAWCNRSSSGRSSPRATPNVPQRTGCVRFGTSRVAESGRG